MTLALFLVDALPVGDTLTLAGDEGHHAAAVKRVRVGEQLLVGDGRGTLLTCEVVSTGRDSVELSVRSRRETPSSDPRLIVVQALPKGDRGDLAVELLTELGVDEIVPWAAARAVTRWDPDRVEKARSRWQRTAREATKQSRRAWLPTITGLASTGAVGARIRAASAALVLDENADVGIGAAALARSGELILVVGPEGGISPDELAEFAAAGATSVRMGEPVLRTSTAGGAALAALNPRLDRWR